MPFARFRTIGPITIAAAAKGETSEIISDFDETIHRIFFIETSGLTLTQLEVNVRVDSITLEKEPVPAVVYGSDAMNAVVLDIPWPRDRKFKVSYENKHSVSVKIYIVLELWK